MFWIKYLQGLLKALNDNTSPSELAAGFALGAMLGLIPKFNLLALLIWLVLLLLQVNISMSVAATVIFSILGSLTDPLAERLGFFLLSGVPFLRPLWIGLYNTPIIPFSNFNNTLVMGNFVLGLLLWLPIFFAFRRGVRAHRSFTQRRPWREGQSASR